MTTNSTVQRLYLGDSKIGPPGAQSLSRMLQQNDTLQALDLDQNNIGPEGAQALAPALRSNTSLTDLLIQRNGIGDVGCQAVAASLVENRSLVCIDMALKGIDDRGTQCVAAALRRNCCLRVLSLSDSIAISSVGMSALKETLRLANYSLHLFVYDDDEHDAEIREIIAKNRRIKENFDRLQQVFGSIGLATLPRALELVSDKPGLLYPCSDRDRESSASIATSAIGSVQTG